ncbi:hypothetical protein E4U30_007158 [Claviceps sp. LM220 group G6]|nr:hypothetical protein E4U30_007158 [Claviceps sp. LM220 group G6]
MGVSVNVCHMGALTSYESLIKQRFLPQLCVIQRRGRSTNQTWTTGKKEGQECRDDDDDDVWLERNAGSLADEIFWFDDSKPRCTRITPSVSEPGGGLMGPEFIHHDNFLGDEPR